MWLLASFLLAGSITIGNPVSGPGYKGIAIGCAPEASSHCWQPTPEHIRSLERELAARAKQRSPVGLSGLLRPPLEYVRQYIGSGSGTERLIHVVGYHRSDRVVTSGEWQNSVIRVAGGGGNCFSGVFNVGTGQFTQLAINAPL